MYCLFVMGLKSIRLIRLSSSLDTNCMNNNEDEAHLKDSLFCHGVSDLVLLDDDLLLQDLDGVQLVCRFLTTHNHLKTNNDVKN